MMARRGSVDFPEADFTPMSRLAVREPLLRSSSILSYRDAGCGRPNTNSHS